MQVRVDRVYGCEFRTVKIFDSTKFTLSGTAT